MPRIKWKGIGGGSDWLECKAAWVHDGFLGIQVNDRKVIWVPAQVIEGLIVYEREVQDEAANVAPDAS